VKADLHRLTGEYEEGVGDSCFEYLVGTKVLANGTRSEKCTIPKYCVSVMTSRGKKEYAATHQLLYVMQSKRVGCNEKLRHELGHAGISHFEQHSCSKIYEETSQASMTGQVALDKQDLFLEQVMVCALLGFQDFFKSEWLNMILTWQYKNGCFGDENPGRFSMRKLMFERDMAGGCLSHKSGLGTAVLGIYLRHLVENNGNFFIQS